MQVEPSTSRFFLDLASSPAIVIAAVALAVRLVVAPALTNYLRKNLQSELAQIAQFPLFVERVKTLEVAIERLSEIPESLARIEEQVRSLHEERRQAGSAGRRAANHHGVAED